MIRKSYFKFIFVAACFFLSLAAFAIPPTPPNGGGGAGGGGGPPCWPPPCVPIDGGLSFLLIAGAAYGGKKAYDFKKNKSEKA